MNGNFDPRIHVPGVWRCAKCSFRLIQSNLNAHDGTVSARDEAGEPCPNCAVPLWRVTWREEAEDARKSQETIWERGLEAGKRYTATAAVAAWMLQRGYATGHGDTVDDLLAELEGHAKARAIAQHYGEQS